MAKITRKKILHNKIAAQEPEFAEGMSFNPMMDQVFGEIIIQKRRHRSDCLYKPQMCDVVIEIGKKGGDHAEMALALGVSMQSFMTYKKKYEEFSEAVEYADLCCLAIDEHTQKKGIRGEIKGYNAVAHNFRLMNKHKALYNRTGEESRTTVTINNLTLTPEQVNDKIAQIAEKLQARGILIPQINAPVTIEQKQEENHKVDDYRASTNK